MKRICIQLIFIFISSACLASNYKVDAVVDQFIVYEDEPILIEVIIKPSIESWIVDKSGRSRISKNECGGEDEFSTIISVEVEGTGVKEIGPYLFTLGNEVLETKTIKIIKIARKAELPDFEIITKSDPNDTGLFHIKIEYRASKEKNGIHVIEMDHWKLPKGVKFKSGSSSVENDRVFCDFTVKKITDDKIILTGKNFIDIPDWIIFPDIEITKTTP